MNIPKSLATKALIPLLAGLLLLQGCAATLNDKGIGYSTHNIGLTCYSGVTNAWLKYAGLISELCVTQVAREKLASDVNRVPGSTAGYYKAFTGLMEMKWRARDGTQLSHTVDLNKEVPDPRIPYAHPERVYAKAPFLGNPTIVVEYDDRTANVYVAATLQVRSLDPSKGQLEHVDTYTLIYTRTL